MGSGMSMVPRRERRRVRVRAWRLRRVAAGVPGISRRVRVRACVQVAAIAPHLSGDRLSLLARHALWSYRLDDRLDAPDADLAAVERLREGVAAVTTGGVVGPPAGVVGPPAGRAGPAGGGAGSAGSVDTILSELARMVREVSGYDQGGILVRAYGASLRDTLAAEVATQRARVVWSASGVAPTSEQYLALAARTINYRSFAYVLLAAGGDRLDARQVRRIDAALRHASRAVRLANDVRSLDRDRRAGTWNVLQLRTAAGEVVTTGSVWGEVSRRVRAHDATLRALSRRGLVPESSARALTRCLARQVHFYQRTDVR